jgi:glycine hydroxymethyltransferase
MTIIASAMIANTKAINIPFCSGARAPSWNVCRFAGDCFIGKKECVVNLFYFRFFEVSHIMACMDTAINELINREKKRQARTLDLIPSENIVSKDVLRALGSVFTHKYAEGYSALRYYCGNEVVDDLEELCKKRALEAFSLSPDAWHVNVQPYSGSTANMAVYLALVPIGGTIMGLQLDMGGHLTHGHGVSATGKIWRSVSYGVDRKTSQFNYAEILKLAKKERPAIIIAGGTAYPRAIDFKKFRAIADAVDAYFLADVSHIAGLIAGAAHESPFSYADVVMMTTHKTLRGPRGALLFANRQSKLAAKNGVSIPKLIDRAIFPGLQGGPHANQIAATAVALHEATLPAFKKYAEQTVKNARALGAELVRLGWPVVSGGTDTHLLLIDTFVRGIAGKEAGERLEAQGIIVNKNAIPFDERKPADPSGIRIGTPVLTTRGMKEREMKTVAQLISMVLLYNADVKKEVGVLCKKFPVS